MPADYSKAFLTVPDQIRLLRSRGMVVANDFDAMTLLRNVGYYRSSQSCAE
jgi:abortive infection bacteriophage resistance protein